MRIGRRADCDAFDPSLILAAAPHDDGVIAPCRDAGELHSLSPIRCQTDDFRSDRPFRLIQHADIARPVLSPLAVTVTLPAPPTAVIVASADAAPAPSAASETVTTIVARTWRAPLVVVALTFMMVSPYIRYGHEAVG